MERALAPQVPRHELELGHLHAHGRTAFPGLAVLAGEPALAGMEARHQGIDGGCLKEFGVRGSLVNSTLVTIDMDLACQTCREARNIRRRRHTGMPNFFATAFRRSSQPHVQMLKKKAVSGG